MKNFQVYEVWILEIWRFPHLEFVQFGNFNTCKCMNLNIYKVVHLQIWKLSSLHIYIFKSSKWKRNFEISKNSSVILKKWEVTIYIWASRHTSKHRNTLRLELLHAIYVWLKICKTIINSERRLKKSLTEECPRITVN